MQSSYDADTGALSGMEAVAADGSKTDIVINSDGSKTITELNAAGQATAVEQTNGSETDIPIIEIRYWLRAVTTAAQTRWLPMVHKPASC